ncbi:hypothetical protein GH714_040675 [Hevea brasiliensis]|uniref:Uncharacterized protein n=1 Tax=Hevea brasiliensis TaxID=3981 RepID=A0A6A6KZ91_HEVBR|nr:hypothetical protein GH714_040675 [Hevea brasiliensis]
MLNTEIELNYFHSVGACVHGPKVKFLKISAFKGSAQNKESGNRANGSEVAKNSVNLSYVPKESGETIMESPKFHSVPVSYTSDGNGGIAGSPAIHKLFKKWLNMLRTDSPSQVADEILREPPSSEELQQTQNTVQTKEGHEILKPVWFHFLGLDATIKIPLLIFIPLYLAVNVIYGVDVSKELTPLWILGPLIVVFYINVLRVLWTLYVFSFKQTVKLTKNLPTYYLVASSYISQGKLKQDVEARVFQPVGSIKNLDYKELSRKRLKEFEEWFMDMYLDFVESIWPIILSLVRSPKVELHHNVQKLRNTKDFLILFFTEALFYCGVVVFLLLIDHLRRPMELECAENGGTTLVPHLGQRISSVATLVLSLIIPMVTMGLVWPWTGPAASATLAPYLVGIIVQFAFEQYAKYRNSPSWPVIPIIFQVYRLHQLNRAAQLVTALSFTVKGAEMTSHNLEISSSLGTLLNVLQFLGVICIWSLSSFLMKFYPFAGRTAE